MPEKEVKKDEEPQGSSKDNKTKTEEPVEMELSEEDKQLKEDLEMCVERLTETDDKLYKAALEQLRKTIRESTSSMTSVPKPLKFLMPHYDALKAVYEKMKDSDCQKLAAEIVSVLAMTLPDDKMRDCLSYRLLGVQDELGSWGHEYVRHLTAEIAQAYNDGEEEESDEKPKKVAVDDLYRLSEEIVQYCMKHNAEAEACDLVMEIERLDMLEKYVEKDDFARVCLYLVSCVPYVPEPEDTDLLRSALRLYKKFGQHANALLLAIRLNDKELYTEIFNSVEDATLKKQLAFLLARQSIYIDTGDDDLNELMSNARLSENFLALARDLDIMEPKVPEDIYKSHLEPTRTSGYGASNIESARQKLAGSLVNGFVNTSFGQDKWMTSGDVSQHIYTNKDHGKMTAAASLGLVQLWDVDHGLGQIDKLLYSDDEYIKAGALLACGLVTANVRSEIDPALALLNDYVSHSTKLFRVGSIIGLGVAYAGTEREEVVELLLPTLSEGTADMETLGVAAVSLGMVCVGTANADVTQALLSCMMERTEAQCTETHVLYLALGLALCYLGRQESADLTKEALKVLPKVLQDPASVLLDICAYAGTGNVLKVQQLLHMCSEHVDKEKEEDDRYQSIAVLGLGLIAMNEDIGAEMALRSFGHLLQYGEEGIRRAVPLAMGLMCASNPKLTVLDTLSKLSHDGDPEVAHNSILAMGLVGCGTNNARVAAMLRNLAVYYHKDEHNLFMTRLAQGLLHMGKGTMTISPYHTDRSLMSLTTTASLMAIMIACLDVKNTILSTSHYLLYYLTPAIAPRMLTTFDEDLNPLQVTVRVGQAVDVVGQAGKPKTITGFQTHTTPVLLAYGERAELANEEYIALSPVLEGLVILRKNPDYEGTKA